MDPGYLIDGVLRSVMGGRGKKSRKALRYLTGGKRSSFMSNPATLLTAAGVAWGVYETLQGQGSTRSEAPGGPVPGSEGATQGSPAGAARSAPAAVPPVPWAAGAADDEAVRLVRLAIAAAHADGSLSERERAAIVRKAAEAGVADVVEREIARPSPLAEIVSGVAEPAQRATLYVLAFTILRADEQVGGAERIFLARLAQLLGLDPQAVQQLEQDAGERIEALGDQGQPGG